MNLRSRKSGVIISQFYALIFVALTGILGMVSSPDLSVMVAQAQTPKQRQAEAERLFNQGKQFTKSEQFQKAIDSFQQSLAITRQLGNTKVEPVLLYLIGGNYLLLQDLQKAREFLLQSIELAKKIGDRETEAKATDFLNQTRQSLPAPTNQDRQAEAVRLFNQGKQFTESEQFQKAIDSFQQSLAISRQLGNTKVEPVLLYAIGANHSYLGDFQKARESFLRSIELAKKIGDRETEMNATDFLNKISK